MESGKGQNINFQICILAFCLSAKQFLHTQYTVQCVLVIIFGNKKVHESVIKLILMSNNISSSSHSDSSKTCSYLSSYKTKIMNLYFHVSLLMKILSPSLRSIALSIPTIVHNVILILALSHLICCSGKKAFSYISIYGKVTSDLHDLQTFFERFHAVQKFRYFIFLLFGVPRRRKKKKT